MIHRITSQVNKRRKRFSESTTLEVIVYTNFTLFQPNQEIRKHYPRHIQTVLNELKSNIKIINGWQNHPLHDSNKTQEKEDFYFHIFDLVAEDQYSTLQNITASTCSYYPSFIEKEFKYQPSRKPDKPFLSDYYLLDKQCFPDIQKFDSSDQLFELINQDICKHS